jgi:hypothetical protein
MQLWISLSSLVLLLCGCSGARTVSVERYIVEQSALRMPSRAHVRVAPIGVRVAPLTGHEWLFVDVLVEGPSDDAQAFAKEWEVHTRAQPSRVIEMTDAGGSRFEPEHVLSRSGPGPSGAWVQSDPVMLAGAYTVPREHGLAQIVVPVPVAMKRGSLTRHYSVRLRDSTEWPPLSTDFPVLAVTDWRSFDVRHTTLVPGR